MKKLLALIICCFVGSSFAAPTNCIGLNNITWKSDSLGARYDAAYWQCIYTATANFNSEGETLTANIDFIKINGPELCDDEIHLQVSGYCKNKMDSTYPIWLYDNKGNRLSGAWTQPERIGIYGTVTLPTENYPGYMSIYFVPR